MNRDELIATRKAEVGIAHIRGWDFLHVALRVTQAPLPFPDQYLHPIAERFARAGFEILAAEECFR